MSGPYLVLLAAFRCCHANVLPLLGFCTGGQCHSLIYPYMANGSLQDRLQGQVRVVVVRDRKEQCLSLGQGLTGRGAMQVRHRRGL